MFKTRRFSSICIKLVPPLPSNTFISSSQVKVSMRACVFLFPRKGQVALQRAQNHATRRATLSVRTGKLGLNPPTPYDSSGQLYLLPLIRQGFSNFKFQIRFCQPQPYLKPRCRLWRIRHRGYHHHHHFFYFFTLQLPAVWRRLGNRNDLPKIWNGYTTSYDT